MNNTDENKGKMIAVDVHITRTPVAGGGSANIHAQPSIAFRPEWLLIPREVAIHFLVTGVYIGKSSQLVSTTTMPATIFVDKVASVRLKMEPCHVSMFVTVSLINLSDETQFFEAHVQGECMR